MKPPGNSNSRLLRRAAVICEMGTAVIANGEEPNYAQEKLWRAFTAAAAALIDDLHVDGQELVDKIEVLIDGEER